MSENIEQISDNQFEEKVIESDVPVLVDFWAPWCGPCRMLGPVLEKIAKERDGGVRVVKVNVDESQGIAGQMGVKSIPTVMLFHEGELKEMAVGVRSKPSYDEMIDRAVSGGAPRILA